MVVLLGSQDRREHTYLVQDCNELKHLTAKENPEQEIALLNTLPTAGDQASLLVSDW